MLGLGIGIGLGHNVAALSGGGGGGTWVPADAGAWEYDPADINTGSSNVWPEASATGPTLTQATSSKRGTVAGGGLSFDTDDELAIAGAPTIYDAIAAVTSNSSNASYRTLFWDQAAEHALVLETGTNNLGVYDGGFQDSGFDVATSTDAIVHLRVNASRQASISLNGGSITGTLATFAVGEQIITIIGNASGGTQPFGTIKRLIIKDGLLDATAGGDLDRAIAYAAWQASLESLLPGGHPYKSAAP